MSSSNYDDAEAAAYYYNHANRTPGPGKPYNPKPGRASWVVTGLPAPSETSGTPTRSKIEYR